MHWKHRSVQSRQLGLLFIALVYWNWTNSHTHKKRNKNKQKLCWFKSSIELDLATFELHMWGAHLQSLLVSIQFTATDVQGKCILISGRDHLNKAFCEHSYQSGNKKNTNQIIWLIISKLFRDVFEFQMAIWEKVLKALRNTQVKGCVFMGILIMAKDPPMLTKMAQKLSEQFEKIIWEKLSLREIF